MTLISRFGQPRKQMQIEFRKCKLRVSVTGEVSQNELNLCCALKRQTEYLDMQTLEGKGRMLTHTKQMDCMRSSEIMKGLDILSKEFRLSTSGHKDPLEIFFFSMQRNEEVEWFICRSDPFQRVCLGNAIISGPH